jgi:hypothetical protein
MKIVILIIKNFLIFLKQNQNIIIKQKQIWFRGERDITRDF